MMTAGPTLLLRSHERKAACALPLAFLLLFPSLLAGQLTTQADTGAEARLQQHYDAARTFQLSGDQEHAAAEYKAFVSGALDTCANADAQAGQFSEAADLFEGALG